MSALGNLFTTVTPLHATPPDSDCVRIWYVDGDLCAKVEGNLDLGIDGEAMAGRIVHAVNTYDRREEALREALEQLRHGRCSVRGCCCDRPGGMCSQITAIAKIKAALAVKP